MAVSAEPAVSAGNLPADVIYPPSRKLAFAGHSGDPARDLASGFVLAGPVYGYNPTNSSALESYGLSRVQFPILFLEALPVE